MKSKLLFLGCLILVFTGCSPKTFVKPGTTVARFNDIKALAGNWESVEADPKTKSKETVMYRVMSGGSAVEEVLFPNTAHEMVSVYYKDGEKLGLTHYCALGNRPELRAVPSDDKSLSFDFVPTKGIDPSKDSHIHNMKLTFVSPTKIEHLWSGYENGVAGKDKRIEFVRKKK